MMPLADLVARWRADALVLHQHGCASLADLNERHADAVEAALRQVHDESLTLAEAARESGYSPDRLRHLVSEGAIPNAGRRGSPRLRRGDLPKKKRHASTFDAAEKARGLLRGDAGGAM